MKLPYSSSLQQLFGHQSGSLRKVLGSVQLVGEIVGGIDDGKGLALRNQSFKGSLVEDVDKALTLYHLFQFTEQHGGVVGCHLF